MWKREREIKTHEQHNAPYIFEDIHTGISAVIKGQLLCDFTKNSRQINCEYQAVVQMAMILILEILDRVHCQYLGPPTKRSESATTSKLVTGSNQGPRRPSIIAQLLPIPCHSHSQLKLGINSELSSLFQFGRSELKDLSPFILRNIKQSD